MLKLEKSGLAGHLPSESTLIEMRKEMAFP
jgi:hypothetical protein